MKDHIKHILRNIALISIVSAWLVYATEINTLLQTVNKWDQINADWYNAVNSKLSTVGAASGWGGPFCVPIADTASCVSTVAQYGVPKSIIYHPLGQWNGTSATFAALITKTSWNNINVTTGGIACWAYVSITDPYYPSGTNWYSIWMEYGGLGVWTNSITMPFQADIHFCYN